MVQSSLSITTVLLVEDDPDQATAVAALLRDLGVPRILVADNAEAALEWMRQQAIDVVICDLGLPGRDGLSVIRDISRLPQLPALVVLSGVERGLLETVGRLAVEMGLRLLGTLSKPVREEELIGVLARFTTADATLAPPLPTTLSPAGKSVPDAEAVSDAALLEALGKGWFQPHYEARVEVRTGQVTGVELLARLCPPGQPVLPPAQFIERLETLGRVDEMTWQIATRGLAYVAACAGEGLRLTTSINVSPSMLEREDFTGHMASVVEAAGLRCEDVILEVTESLALDPSITVIERLVHLRLRGFGLSIDDFGTGFSSLMRLSRIPFTEMKIDRGFIVRLPGDAKSRSVVESSVDLARRLGLRVCAEGVESADILHAVCELGVDSLQGYHFHRPMPGADFLRWARQHNGSAAEDGCR